MTYVSCIMPTANRRRFVKRSIAQFLAQDYNGPMELIIGDDGDDSVKDLAEGYDNVRYFPHPKATLGAKRNTLCRMALGEVILFWDDDDLYAPWRIRYQVNELVTSGANINGLNKLLFREEDSGRLWFYEWPAWSGPWLHGGTFGFWKAYWAERGFGNVQYHEDLSFIFRAMGEEIPPQAMERWDWYIGAIHETNISYKRREGPHYRQTNMLPVWATRVLQNARR